MHDPSEIRSLPIDIAFGRLQEWLVDRKRVPQDWRKRLAGIRARVAAFASLPRDLHSSLLTLEPDEIGYLESKKIYSILLESNTESRNASQDYQCYIYGEWESIVKAYEKDHVFLGATAQIMVQNVNYDIWLKSVSEEANAEDSSAAF